MPLRFLYTGDKGSSVYKCGFDVKNIQPEDYGEWRCDVWSYYDGSNKWRSYASTTSMTFQVEEEKNATTIIRYVLVCANGRQTLSKSAVDQIDNILSRIHQGNHGRDERHERQDYQTAAGV